MPFCSFLRAKKISAWCLLLFLFPHSSVGHQTPLLCPAFNDDAPAMDTELNWRQIKQMIESTLDWSDRSDFRPMQARVESYDKLKNALVYGTTHMGVACPIGMVALRIFIIWLANDADRCIQVRDHNIGAELLDVPFHWIILSRWPIFRLLHKLQKGLRATSFPVHNQCDVLVGEDDELLEALKNDVWAPIHFLRLLEAMEHKKKDSAALRRCPFGTAVGYFALAARQGYSNSTRDVAVADVITQGQHWLQRWSAESERPLYDMLTSEWPIWDILDRIAQNEPIQSPKKPWMVPRNVIILVCGILMNDIREKIDVFATKHSWNFFSGSVRDCVAYDAPERRANAFVLVIANIWGWDEEVEKALLHGIEIMEHTHSIDIAGFPLLSDEKRWTWNVKQIIKEHWKLEYRTFPTGYATSVADECFEGDASSSTRIFRSFKLWNALVKEAQLLSHFEADEDRNNDDVDLNWIVELDLAIRRSKDFKKVFSDTRQDISSSAQKFSGTPSSEHFSPRN